MTVYKWSTTPSANDAIDNTINWRERQAPSGINNAARAMMAAIKKWWLDLGGMLDTGGTSTAYTLTTNQSISTLTDGACVAARMSATNGLNPTLSVDGTTAKAITLAPGVAVEPGTMVSGSVQRFTYDQGDDEWRLNGYQAPSGALRTGDLKYKATSVADPGWVKADGRTIGNAASGGTSRANADTSALFQQLWADYNNTLLPIQDSAGSVTTRGLSASADYAANKRLPLPDVSGRMFAGLDNLSGTSRNVVVAAAADTLGGTVGAETATILRSDLPNVAPTITINDPGHAHGYLQPGSSTNRSLGTPQALVSDTRSQQNTDTATTGITATSQSLNGGVAQTNVNKMPPTFFGYVFIKL